MISHTDIIQYMQESVAQNTELGDNAFFRLNISELQGALRSGISSPCLALESHEGNFDGSKTNNSVDVKTFNFSILKKVTLGNFDEENTALDACEILGKKFLARMRYHSTKSEHFLYKLFDLTNCNYHKVGPVFTNWYGYRFEVKLKPSKINMQVAPEDWEDITETC